MILTLARSSAGTVVAACRDPSSATDLHALGSTAGKDSRLDVVKMDIEDQASLEAAAEHVKNAYGVSCYCSKNREVLLLRQAHPPLSTAAPTDLWTRKG